MRPFLGKWHYRPGTQSRAGVVGYLGNLVDDDDDDDDAWKKARHSKITLHNASQLRLHICKCL